MKTILRNNKDGSISHVYLVTIDGTHHYVTSDDFMRLMSITIDDVKQYYSGDRGDEYDSLIEDVTQLTTGELDIKRLQLRIGEISGLIKDDIIKING